MSPQPCQRWPLDMACSTIVIFCMKVRPAAWKGSSVQQPTGHTSEVGKKQLQNIVNGHLQSINQSNFYSANIPAEDRLSGATTKSVFNSNIEETVSVTSTGHGQWPYLWGGGWGQIKEICLQIFLEGSNWTGWMDRQRQVVPKRLGTRVKISSTSIGLDPRDWQTIIIVWSQ